MSSGTHGPFNYHSSRQIVTHTLADGRPARHTGLLTMEAQLAWVLIVHMLAIYPQVILGINNGEEMRRKS